MGFGRTSQAERSFPAESRLHDPPRENGHAGRHSLPQGQKRRDGESRDDALASYISAIGQIPLLSAQEESEAAIALQQSEEKCWVHLLQCSKCGECLRVALVAGGQQELATKLVSFLAKKAATSASTLREELAVQLRLIDEDKRLLYMISEHCAKEPARRGHGEFLRVARTLMRESQRRRNDFVSSNLRLVVSVAKKYHHHRLSLNDLIQEGNIGLLKSVQRFDPHKGFRFSTYAHWWIRQAIERSIMNKGCQIRLPVHVYEQRRELAKAKHELEQSFGREPSIEELSKALGVSESRVEDLMQTVPSEPQSLDEMFGDHDGRTLMESIVDPRHVSVEEMVSCVDDARTVCDALDQLTPMERDIINRRFGLNLGDDETLEEIGESYRLSRERVRQIQVKSLRKIATYCTDPGAATV